MTIQIGNSAVTGFEPLVHQVYQEMGGKLRSCVRVKNVKGEKTHKFPVMGKGTAELRGAMHSDVTPMNLTHAPVSVSVSEYVAADYTDIFKSNQVNFDEKLEVAKSIAMALTRREDQIILNALDAASSSLTVADTISGSADNLTLAALRESARLLDGQGVPSGDRVIVVHPDGLHHLLADTTVTSDDFNTVKALVNGDLDTFYGFKFVKIADMAEGGLPVPSSNHRTNYAWHKSAMGLVVNMEPKIEINYIPEKLAWLITGTLAAGAVAIDATGIVEITNDES
jgi:hypothetical protein